MRGVARLFRAETFALQVSGTQIKMQAHFIFQVALQRIGAENVSQTIEPRHTSEPQLMGTSTYLCFVFFVLFVFRLSLPLCSFVVNWFSFFQFPDYQITHLRNLLACSFAFFVVGSLVLISVSA
jgi:hypothetical protein